MLTERLYYFFPKLGGTTAKILAIGAPEIIKYKRGSQFVTGECPYIVLDKTIFGSMKI